MKKIIAFLMCLIVLITVLSVGVVATDDVAPCANNVALWDIDFSISEYGHASYTVKYIGYSGITTGGSITIQMQKKFLGLFWRDVEGKYWELSSNQVNYSYQNVVQLSDTGKYRIVVNFTIYGTGGAADQFEKTAEAEW
ncbi:MAG: hypothetical protein E7650_00240 [Ruminococcaceae bacterium]|nr:hypothetical protein [Oscillospiraceae bacterium]